MGSWVLYGLGAETEDLPGYVVLMSAGRGGQMQPIAARQWSAGILPSKLQGVKLNSIGDPVLYIQNPAGMKRELQKDSIDAIGALNKSAYGKLQDPEILTRVSQYEMAFRMQMSVPELTDISKESAETLAMYGPEVNDKGTFAYNCLLARRLAERGVRFTQVFLRGWDHHGSLPQNFPQLCKAMDQPAAALIKDLKQRGMLDETLVVWGGEFGRTVYSQGALTKDTYGRDHHPRCFTMWMAGGGVRPGMVYGETDDFSYNVARDPVHVHDLNATLLHLMGLNHEQLTYRHSGRDFRLTDVHGHVVRPILA